VAHREQETAEKRGTRHHWSTQFHPQRLAKEKVAESTVASNCRASNSKPETALRELRDDGPCLFCQAALQQLSHSILHQF
jgi:hypothetical protein